MKAKKIQAEQRYEKRLKLYYDELKWLYMELYPERSDQFENLLYRMQEAYHARKPNLKKFDESRVKNTDWYKKSDLLGMMLYTDAFAENLNGVKNGWIILNPVM